MAGGGFVKITRKGNFGRAIQTLEIDGKRLVRDVVLTAAEHIANDAKRRVSISTALSRKAKTRPGPGELRDTIRAEAGKADMPVAYVRAGLGKLRRRSRATTAKGKAAAARVRRMSAKSQQALGVYAMVIEYGAPQRGVAAHPYMRPSLDHERPFFRAQLRRVLDEAVRRATGAR